MDAPCPSATDVSTGPGAWSLENHGSVKDKPASLLLDKDRLGAEDVLASDGESREYLGFQICDGYKRPGTRDVMVMIFLPGTSSGP